MTAPDWLIETMNVEPVVRQSASKHSAWKYMIAANGPIRSDVPQCDNNIGDYDYHECTRGIDSLTASKMVAPSTENVWMPIQTSIQASESTMVLLRCLLLKILRRGAWVWTFKPVAFR